MSFAYWRKCDFQVHSPRDPNWGGARPIGQGDTDPATGQPADADAIHAARAHWADEFVQRCAKAGLGAIALTDHHEMVMVPYVQNAIESRKKADPHFDLWLFPGMELTANSGKQCLILFDADLSQEWWKQAQAKLGIVYVSQNELSPKAAPVTQLEKNYSELGDLLEGIAELKGKYIILPNVSEGGRFSVLTNGGHGDFRRMPYVGGYLDVGQTIEKLSARNRRRLSGEDPTWSSREIYPLPTSDSRTAGFDKLGKNQTWIKLAEPTAEAIRQAFLGHQSRICVQPPCVPSLYVASIKIEGSSILEPCELELSNELNAVIGGRGSGKSSLLEYIAFGLGRSCYDLPREDTYSGTQRMHELISDTIVAKNARVSLKIVQDNAIFIIDRSPANAYRPQVTYPNDSVQTITAKELRALFPGVVYSQGELAEIGKQANRRTKLADLLQFVNPDYKREDDRLALEVEQAKGGVRTAIQKLTEHWLLQAKLRKLITERDSALQRAQALEKTLPALSDEDQEIVKNYDVANEFESKRLLASRHAEQMSSTLLAVSTEHLSERNLATELKNGVSDFRQAYGDLYRSFEAGLKALRKEFDEKRDRLVKAEEKWATDFKALRAARDGVLEKLGEQKNVTAQIIKLRENVTALSNEIGELESQIQAAGDPSMGLKGAIDTLNKSGDRRADKTKQWAAEIEKLSSGKIKAEFTADANVGELHDALDALSAKTGSQEATRRAALDEALKVSNVADVVDKLRADALSALYWQLIGATQGEDEPKCDNLFRMLGNTDRIRKAMLEVMDAGRVESISTAMAKPEIALFYCDRSREISFDKASEGQRAAALLFMLLEQPGGPLIVDQPEGDLDNKIIADLTDKLHLAKQNRQIMFASHNANIVVNGSSELVAHMDIDDSGNRNIQCAGAIDTPEVCGVITSTMEGGEKAFKDRQGKYGY